MGNERISRRDEKGHTNGENEGPDQYQANAQAARHGDQRYADHECASEKAAAQQDSAPVEAVHDHAGQEAEEQDG
jgi:hypothetical protein